MFVWVAQPNLILLSMQTVQGVVPNLGLYTKLSESRVASKCINDLTRRSHALSYSSDKAKI